jgi:hypothetical protein
VRGAISDDRPYRDNNPADRRSELGVEVHEKRGFDQVQRADPAGPVYLLKSGHYGHFEGYFRNAGDPPATYESTSKSLAISL